jgi:hypothetical protein
MSSFTCRISAESAVFPGLAEQNDEWTEARRMGIEILAACKKTGNNCESKGMR